MNTDKHGWILLSTLLTLLACPCYARECVGEAEIDGRTFENYRASHALRDRMNSQYQDRILKWQFPLSKEIVGYSYPMSDDGSYVLQTRTATTAAHPLADSLPLTKALQLHSSNGVRARDLFKANNRKIESGFPARRIRIPVGKVPISLDYHLKIDVKPKYDPTYLLAGRATDASKATSFGGMTLNR